MEYPKILTLKKKTCDASTYQGRFADESDYTVLIKKSTVIVNEEKKPTIVYLVLDDDFSEIVDAVQHIEYEVNHRTKGMFSRSQVFGYLPRLKIRRDFCNVSKIAYLYPKEHEIIARYAEKVAMYYQRFYPELYQKHQQMTEKVLSDWKLENTLFTSGIVNKDNQLPYHFDAGNFKDVWSNMLVFKNEIRGGYLSVPEYDLGFELVNNSLLMFDGQSLVHGVTPIYQKSEKSYRYSIVYYSLQEMWRCLTPDEERERIERLRTEREEKRYYKHLQKS